MTYAGLAVVFVVVAAGVAVGAAAVRRPGGRWWATTAAVAGVLVLLTAVFDSLMVAADLFRYDDGALAGARVWLAPVEDLAWPVAAALLLPGLWTLLDRRRVEEHPPAVRRPAVERERGREGGAWAAVRQLVGASRPVSWINTAYPFAAAFLMSGGAPGWLLAVGTLYFLVPYNLLMYGLNDVFDYESDVRNPRKGGLEGLVLSRRWHRLTVTAAVVTNVPFLAVLLVAGSPASAVALAVTVFAVVAYSVPRLRFKERPLVDSATSSTHFVGPAVVGLCLAGGDLTWVALASLSAFFLWGMASQAFGAVQDIEADRAGGISSVATWLGAARTVRLTLALYAAAGLVMVTAGWPAALAALLTVPYLVSVAPFRSLADAEAERARAGWRRFLWLNQVTGFLVTQLLIWIWWTR